MEQLADEIFDALLEGRDLERCLPLAEAHFLQTTDEERFELLDLLAQHDSEIALRWMLEALAKGHPELCGLEMWSAARTFVDRERFASEMRGAIAAFIAADSATDCPRGLAELAVEVLNDEASMHAVIRISKSLPDGEQGVESLVVAARMKLAPESLIDEAVEAVMLPSSPHGVQWGSVLYDLAEQAGTRKLVAERLTRAMREHKFQFPLMAAIGAIAVSGADYRQVWMTDDARRDFERELEELKKRRARSQKLIEWLIDNGWVGETRRNDIDASHPPLRVLEDLGVGIGFDPETGILPVPYDPLFGELAAKADFAAESESVDLGRTDHVHRYTLTVHSDGHSCGVTFESPSDYRHTDRMLAVLNELCEKVGDARRYRAVDTSDQTVFVLFGEPAKLRDLARVAQLRFS